MKNHISSINSFNSMRLDEDFHIEPMTASFGEIDHVALLFVTVFDVNLRKYKYSPMNFQTSGKDFLKTEDFLTTGCSKIDEFLRGGISRRGITQIYGEAGSGKTQFALQLSLAAQIPLENGCRKGVLYISTESVFPSRRLQQLLETSPIAQQHESSSDLIFVEHISTVGDLEKCILSRIPVCLSTQRIGLLVIDSIAAPYRVAYEQDALKSRAKSLRTIGQALQSFSVKNNLSILCINQVSAGMGTTKGICHDHQPVLGITWACQVTNSLYFCKINNQRHIHIRESSYLPRQTLLFDITHSGVHGLSVL